MAHTCNKEIEFLVGLITAGSRLDLRAFDEEREFIFKENVCPRSDKSIYLKQGYTEMNIDIVFKSTGETLESLNYTREAYRTTVFDESHLDVHIKDIHGSDVSLPYITEEKLCLDGIKNLLSSYKIGATIEVNLINNDGNVFDVFFKGLNILFSSLMIPNIKNLKEDIEISYSTPMTRAYAIINDTIIYDPTLLEEVASNAILHVITSNAAIHTIVEGRPIKFDKICEVFQLLA
ncbi:unnamed protein product [Brachionus calyciflorus]|uniref:Uncharacterized protein n=1 Tax=Brachionus calyciflorus TaxID=104777 RepID=A0A813WFM1_9BILA|nr:unnamed protein product [Brachionus calyciflorus]